MVEEEEEPASVQVSKGSVLVHFETTRVHRRALRRCGRPVGSRLGGMESTIDKAPATADGGQFPGPSPVLSLQVWARGKCQVWERRHAQSHESQVDNELMLLSCPRPGGTGRG